MKNGPEPSPGRRHLARSTPSPENAEKRSRIPIPASPSILHSPATPRRRSHYTSLVSLRGVDTDCETDSVRSYGSSCEHSSFARNGTTYSGRSRRYVVHCSSSHDSPHDYLTPTQRANAKIRRLKSMLSDTQGEIDEKDKEIARLTREIVELRLGKAEDRVDNGGEDDRKVNGETLEARIEGHVKLGQDSIEARLDGNWANGERPEDQRVNGERPEDQRVNGPTPEAEQSKEERDESKQTNGNGAGMRPEEGEGIVGESKRRQESSPRREFPGRVTPLHNGHLPSSSATPEPGVIRPHIQHVGGVMSSPLAVSTSLSDSGHFEELSPHASPRISGATLEKEIDKLKHQHEEEVRALKETSNAKVDNLVQRLAEANDRYCELRPQLEVLEEKVASLEKEKQELLARSKDNEERHRQMYLQMFNKGQQAVIFQRADGSVVDGEPILTVPDLIKQLEVTKQELDSVRDREYWKSESLLSGKEAVSLWNMCRKMMYRRLLESKKSKSEQDAEVTLQFLKSAVYYFLTDRENVGGHLAAIQSILGFSNEERAAIERASYVWK